MPELTKGAMWRYFENIVCPEVQARQPSRTPHVRPKLEVLLDQLVQKKPPLSKASYIILHVRYIHVITLVHAGPT